MLLTLLGNFSLLAAALLWPTALDTARKDLLKRPPCRNSVENQVSRNVHCLHDLSQHYFKAAVTRWNFQLKLVCNGAEKQVSAGIASCNIVCFVKLFQTSVARQVSRKLEAYCTSETVATIAMAIKTRASPCNTTS